MLNVICESPVTLYHTSRVGKTNEPSQKFSLAFEIEKDCKVHNITSWKLNFAKLYWCQSLSHSNFRTQICESMTYSFSINTGTAKKKQMFGISIYKNLKIRESWFCSSSNFWWTYGKKYSGPPQFLEKGSYGAAPT